MYVVEHDKHALALASTLCAQHVVERGALVEVEHERRTSGEVFGDLVARLARQPDAASVARRTFERHREQHGLAKAAPPTIDVTRRSHRRASLSSRRSRTIAPAISAGGWNRNGRATNADSTADRLTLSLMSR